MLANYFPVLVFMLIGLAAGILFLALGTLLFTNGKKVRWNGNRRRFE